MHLVSKFKKVVFTLEALNAFATGFYFNWVFFFAQKILHFGTADNLRLVALHGFIYTGAAWLGGWFGHRFGSFAALKLGFAIMAAILGVGGWLESGAGQMIVIAVWTFGMCFTWPMLQSLLSLGEPASAMPKLAGLYNLTWSAIAAISFFIGGTIVEKLGMKAVFLLPACIHAGQFIWCFFLEKNVPAVAPINKAETVSSPVDTDHADASVRKLFLRLALVANPLAYIAINTVIPTMPEVARRFDMTPQWIGFVGAIWFFVRATAFVLFWLWPGWHYRFGWLFAATGALIAGFIGLLISSHVAVFIAAQIVFGLSAGLIYYSSLYYSMHGGNAGSEHGGAHEAMIGLGTFLGATCGVAAKHFWPSIPGISIWVVSGLLAAGFMVLWWLRARGSRALA